MIPFAFSCGLLDMTIISREVPTWGGSTADDRVSSNKPTRSKHSHRSEQQLVAQTVQHVFLFDR